MSENTKLAVEWVSIARLTLNPANPRLNDDAVPHLAGSLKRFGWQQPIVVQRSGVVIAGNTRLKAAMGLGMTEVPVVWFDGSDIEATAYSIADNRLHDLSAWKDDDLAKILEQLRDEDALSGVGFSSEDIDVLLDQLQAEAGAKLEDAGPEAPPVDPVTRTDDLWVLRNERGEHHVLCADSTDAASVKRVMAGQKAALCATDPPYLVDYTGERPNDSGKDWTATYREVDIEDASAFFRAVFQNMLSVLGPKAAIYCWHAHKRSGEIQRIWHELGIVDHQQVVWVKPTAVFGRVYWHFRHEPCVMGWRKGEKPDHDGNHEFDSVWEVDWDGNARFTGDHPTTKPVELFARPMRKHTKPGDIVFEPFLGSGSSLIAAEKLGRRCRAIEIVPAFVDVALLRWRKATGRSAVLESTGQSFSEVAAERGVDLALPAPANAGEDSS